MYFILPATNKTGSIFPAKYPLYNRSFCRTGRRVLLNKVFAMLIEISEPQIIVCYDDWQTVVSCQISNHLDQCLMTLIS